MGIFISLIIVVGFATFVYYDHIKYKKIEEEKREQKEQVRRKMKENEKKYFEENNIPENANTLCCTNIMTKEILTEGKWSMFLWKENDFLNFCGVDEYDEIKKNEIPIENIKYYTRTGDSRVETITEGGGVNLVKAIIGGLVGVVIGWVIGSIMDTLSDAANFRIFTHSSVYSIVLTIIGLLVGLLLAGRKKVTTINKEIDNRKTYLYYSEDNKDKNMIFISKDYDILLKIMPEKEMSYIGNNKIIKADDLQNDNVYKDIEKLSELKDKGILTEDEYNGKKQLLLDKIR